MSGRGRTFLFQFETNLGVNLSGISINLEDRALAYQLSEMRFQSPTFLGTEQTEAVFANDDCGKVKRTGTRRNRCDVGVTVQDCRKPHSCQGSFPVLGIDLGKFLVDDPLHFCNGFLVAFAENGHKPRFCLIFLFGKFITDCVQKECVNGRALQGSMGLNLIVNANPGVR